MIRIDPCLDLVPLDGGSGRANEKKGWTAGEDGAAAGGDGDAPRSAACTGGVRDAQPFLRGGHGGDTPGGAHTPHLDVLHAAGEMCR